MYNFKCMYKSQIIFGHITVAYLIRLVLFYIWTAKKLVCEILVSPQCSKIRIMAIRPMLQMSIIDKSNPVLSKQI